jgi:hypothetical protein
MIGTVGKGWRTILFNFVTGGLAALEAVDAVSLGAVGPWLPMLVMLGNIGLRFVTTTPVGKAE